MIIDTHTHLDGIEFKDDIQDVVQRAKGIGVSKAFVPAIDLSSIESINISRLCLSNDWFAPRRSESKL